MSTSSASPSHASSASSSSPSPSSSSGKPLLVTGAAGHLGRRVLALLIEQRKNDPSVPPLIATTRNPEALADLAAQGVEVRRADFDDEASLTEAFRGAGRALLISTDAVDRPGRRIAQQRAAVRALAAAGVEHVVYTSVTTPVPDSPVLITEDHRLTEEALAASRLDFTVLRNSLYTEYLIETLKGAVASGQLVDARGTGRVGFVTREDCARAAAAALAARTTGRQTLDVTGPEALGSDEVAAILSQLAGRAIPHVTVAPEALVQGLRAHGLPAALAEVLVSFDRGIARGDFAVVSGAVQALTGQAPQSVRTFLHDGASRAAIGLV